MNEREKVYLITVHDFEDPDVPTVRTYAYDTKWKAIRSGIKIINKRDSSNKSLLSYIEKAYTQKI